MWYYKNLKTFQLNDNIEWLHPQLDPIVLNVMKMFYTKYYNDSEQRTLLLGINPGRFGAGVTGINFTSPRQLKNDCKIDHPFKDHSELSAEFIYEVINQFGGPNFFYKHFFIGSVCPLGFIKNKKNINYYDNKYLLKIVEPFILRSLKELLKFPVNRKICICIGGEKNFNYLNSLNNQHHWFESIKALPHPRFIMQYKRKNIEKFLKEYLITLNSF